MAQGRCAGCGKTDGSARKMSNHILSCPEYIELYKRTGRALTPEEEFVRWSNEENDPESRAAAKDERLSKRFAELDTAREVQSARWQKPRDILEDD
jgi:hypothetical protein